MRIFADRCCCRPCRPAVNRSQVEQDVDLLVVLAGVSDLGTPRRCRRRLVRCWRCACSPAPAPTWRSPSGPTTYRSPARLRLGIGRRSPSESTIRRLLQAVDLDALDVGLSAWLAARLPPPQQPSGMHVVTVNKTARGAGIDEGPGCICWPHSTTNRHARTAGPPRIGSSRDRRLGVRRGQYAYIRTAGSRPAG